MYLSELTLENFRCFSDKIIVPFRPDITLLVGENDSGKSAIIDALRILLGTTDQDYLRINEHDFCNFGSRRRIHICARFTNFTNNEKAALVPHITPDLLNPPAEELYINWIAEDTGQIRKGRPYYKIRLYSGPNEQGPSVEPEIRDILRATYLRPLRDAEKALTAGRNSRLSQILFHSSALRDGSDQVDLTAPVDSQEISILGISRFTQDLLQSHSAVSHIQAEIDQTLHSFALSGEQVSSEISVSDGTPDVQYRRMLEKLDLSLVGPGRLGLGSHNLLFIASEMLLIGADTSPSSQLLLIEEIEAHLHVQRQLQAGLRVAEDAKNKGLQVISTTHSPSLTSSLPLESIVIVHNAQAYSMAPDHTCLTKVDYKFLQRFLDSTKSNLFFARGVLIVEGSAESVLLPTISRIIGKSLRSHGVSIVNVGGVGLRRYARIFMRAKVSKNALLKIPVSCITDLDIMPNCAPKLLRKEESDNNWKDTQKRNWRALRDFTDIEFGEYKENKIKEASGQHVRTFISESWTLEYNLAMAGLAEEVHTASIMALEEHLTTTRDYHKSFSKVLAQAEQISDSTPHSTTEVLCTLIYKKIVGDSRISKVAVAQYLADILTEKFQAHPSSLQERLPTYLVEAITYATTRIH